MLTGQLFALVTAFLWTLSSLSFEAASRRAGSVAVNLIRLVMAFAFLCAIGAITRGKALPTDATAYHWKWLLLSGFVGFFIGDLCLFRALVLLGARLCTLIMSLAPIIAAIIGYFWLGERLTSWSFLGMMLTLVGIAWVVSERSTAAADEDVVDPSGEVLGLTSSPGTRGAFATSTSRIARRRLPARPAPGTGTICRRFGAACSANWARARWISEPCSRGFRVLITRAGSSSNRTCCRR